MSKQSIENVVLTGREKGLELISVCYEGHRIKLKWRRKCGHFDFKSYDHIKNNRCVFCKECWLETKLVDCVNKAKARGGQLLSPVFVGRASKLKWSCSQNHIWYASYLSVVCEKHWCPVCGNSLRMSLNNPGCREDVKRKIKDTWIRKYDGHPIFDKTISDKQIRKVNRVFILKHWFSQEEILCKGSWEKKTVEWLNKNNIDYNFHPQCFYISENLRYTPDLYFPDQDLWIEIKGYFRKDAEEKWNWFHKEYPNSELWDRKKLKELGIL